MERDLERDQIQALVFGGLGMLREARFLMLEVKSAAPARAYLRDLGGRIAKGLVTRDDDPASALQVAFTRPGLDALGVRADVVATFPREFKEGMDDDVRAEALGDRGTDNDPVHWDWGRTEPGRDAYVHVLLLVYARDLPTLEDCLRVERERFGAGFFERVERRTKLLPDAKEHFGWRDGLSSPIEEKEGEKLPQWTDPLRIGEFVLGYQNEYKHVFETYNESPTVELRHDPGEILARTRDGTRKDLGRNGTYLVYREMTQKVLTFWRYLEEHSREPGHDAVASAIALGAKMVGRWPAGKALALAPGPYDPPHGPENDFTYVADPAGLKCPLGSHIRRSNPRDGLAPDRGAQDSLEMVRKHQLLRRGRPFGEPIVESMDPREVLANRDRPEDEQRGLHFICLVGHIERQFEFVQRNWVSSANFLGLFKDGDPIAAGRRPAGHLNPSDEFTCPDDPVRRKYKAMPAFTRVVGGAYFFLPGAAALRFIAQEP